MMFKTGSAQETQKVAADFAKKIKGGGVVCLYGELGSGKTTFTQGLAKALGIKERIISPTFIIARRYQIKIQKEKVNQSSTRLGRGRENTNKKSKAGYFWHIDLYRLNSLEEVEAIGISEMWQGNNIVVIEWPEKIEKILPLPRYEIYLSISSTEANNNRKIEINELT